MADWGICTTLKATPEQALAFALHHLDLGAAHVWLHLDDPDDPAIELLAGLPRVTAVRCDAGYWQRLLGRRPPKHQQRQSRNAERVYAACRLPWVAHFDVDEFLYPAQPVGDVLDRVPQGQPILRMAPWEALHDPALDDDIFTARHFRAALRGPAMADLRRVAFGDHANLLSAGALSHVVGKCFFRTGVPGLQPRIHTAVMEGEKMVGGAFAPEIPLLHFHAEDPLRWRRQLAFRQSRGAYSFNILLTGWLGMASEAEIDAFYDRVQVAHPEVLETLRRRGALIEADLALRDRLHRHGFAMPLAG